jgi:release factor glutamine methyltransferase
MNREQLWILNEKYNGVENEAFHADCERLKTGEPLAYIIGSIPFLSTTIHLDSHPLIPRPETEFWVEKAIIHIKQTQNENRYKNRGATPISKLRVLDLCAGSGAIGVAVAKAVPEAQVTFGEIDERHLETIKKNLERNTIIYDSGSITLVASDLFENIEGRFDFILTNPPYIDKAADTVEQSVTDHEPHLALFGGEHGFECITRIIKEARQYLTNTGELWIEHEPSQVTEITRLAGKSGYTVTIHTDQYNVPRYSTLTVPQ